ncbi:hypothetical protein [Agromyces silvae]|uniref:hypothetical protein n=1 Tax=Agromyces silvae TaxID=3388266 RepID=UPI00280AB757|nr:hypothetical protein [Agromyces protaetiae]
MPLESPRRWRDLGVLALGSATLAGGAIAIVAGASPALLAGAAIAMLTVAFAQRASWTLSFAVAILTLLGVHTLIARFAPVAGLEYGAFATAAVVVVGLVAVGVSALLARGRGLRLPAAADLPISIGVLSVPVLSLFYWVGALGWGSQMRVGWILANDAVWNTMAARFIVVDGGIDPAAHPNPAPSTAALAASWMIPGRDAAAEMLRHDVAREAQLVLLVTLAAAVLAGLVAARSVRAAHPVVRVLAGVTGSAFVLGWYVLGFTAELGFLNAPIAVILLLACWVCWTDAPRSPILAAAGLLVAATLLLATWAPVVLVPLALGAMALPVFWQALVARRALAIAVFVVGIAQLVVYGVVVTLGDLRTTGGALAADGAAPPVEPRDVALVVALALVTTVLVLLRRARTLGLRRDAVGVLALLGAGGVGGGYLVLQRLGAGLGWWGYYPAKFAWLLCVLLLIVVLGLLLAVASAARSPRRVALASIAALALVGLVVSGSLPLGGIRRVPAAVALATDAEYAKRGDAADRLFAIADGGPTIAVRLTGDPASDALLNAWLLQAHSEDSSDPVRAYAYGLDTFDATSVCDAMQLWGGGVRLVTGDPLLADELGAVCPDAGYEVVVSS